jgi:hypothetical protein
MGGGIAQAYATMGSYFSSVLKPFILVVTPADLTGHVEYACFPPSFLRVGFCTCMKTAEITRHKQAASGVKPPSTMAVFMDIYRREGIAGINKGVNAVAIRQCTNWGSRSVFIPSLHRLEFHVGSTWLTFLPRSHTAAGFRVVYRIGLARLAESQLRSIRGIGKDEKLTAVDKILSSTVGGALATWNQPIEVRLRLPRRALSLFLPLYRLLNFLLYSVIVQ